MAAVNVIIRRALVLPFHRGRGKPQHLIVCAEAPASSLPNRRVSNMIRVVLCAGVLAFAAGQGLNIPLDFVQDTISMVLGTFNVIVSGCDAVDPNQLEYFYYNRENATTPVRLTRQNLKEVSSQLPTKIILHGWFGSADGPSAIQMKDAYLQKGAYNVIFVNWEQHARANYAQAHCGLSFLGKVTGDFVNELIKQARLDPGRIHLIGHSLGAHLAGYIGQRVYSKQGKKIFRITGLDAAGPGFLGFPEDRRLDAGDATFVDAIHTNGAQFGYPRNYGTADFYPNCGLFQPGCFDLDPLNVSTIFQQTMDNIVCSHNRSVQYFIESINSKRFVANRMKSCYLLVKCAKGTKKKRAFMGENCPVTAKGSYCVNTNSKPPYALGP